MKVFSKELRLKVMMGRILELEDMKELVRTSDLDDGKESSRRERKKFCVFEEK